MDRTVKPAHMALCQRCADGIRQHYGERLEDQPGEWPGVCGFCGLETRVTSFDLWPKQRKAYSPRSGGGERRRAGARP